MATSKDENTTSESKELTAWEAALEEAESNQLMQEKGLSGSSRISFQGGKISVDGVIAPNSGIVGIIVAWGIEHAYYPGKYDPTKYISPVCWALGTSVADMEPDERSEEMQAEVCEGCPKFEWGSDPQGGRGKACKSRIRIAVFADGVLKLATLPVTSSKNFQKYLATLKLVHGYKSAFRAYTRLTCVSNPKTQFEVVLTFEDSVAPEQLEKVATMLKDAAELVATPWEPQEDE
jgi:hypothetical protein